MFIVLALEQDHVAPQDVDSGPVNKFHRTDDARVELRKCLPSPNHVVAGAGVEILALFYAAVFTPEVNLGAQLV